MNKLIFLAIFLNAHLLGMEPSHNRLTKLFFKTATELIADARKKQMNRKPESQLEAFELYQKATQKYIVGIQKTSSPSKSLEFFEHIDDALHQMDTISRDLLAGRAIKSEKTLKALKGTDETGRSCYEICADTLTKQSSLMISTIPDDFNLDNHYHTARVLSHQSASLYMSLSHQSGMPLENLKKELDEATNEKQTEKLADLKKKLDDLKKMYEPVSKKYLSKAEEALNISLNVDRILRYHKIAPNYELAQELYSLGSVLEKLIDAYLPSLSWRHEAENTTFLKQVVQLNAEFIAHTKDFQKKKPILKLRASIEGLERFGINI